jgi:hypothetical protein
MPGTITTTTNSLHVAGGAPDSGPPLAIPRVVAGDYAAGQASANGFSAAFGPPTIYSGLASPGIAQTGTQTPPSWPGGSQDRNTTIINLMKDTGVVFGVAGTLFSTAFGLYKTYSFFSNWRGRIKDTQKRLAGVTFYKSCHIANAPAGNPKVESKIVKLLGEAKEAFGRRWNGKHLPNLLIHGEKNYNGHLLLAKRLA